MNKTDNRHYNRSEKKALGIEMDLWCLFQGKYIYAPDYSYDDKPVIGNIMEVRYVPGSKTNHVELTIDNGSSINIPVKYGKPLIKENILID